MEDFDPVVAAPKDLSLRRTSATDTGHYRKNADTATPRTGSRRNRRTARLSDSSAESGIFVDEVWPLPGACAPCNLRLGTCAHETHSSKGSPTALRPPTKPLRFNSYRLELPRLHRPENLATTAEIFSGRILELDCVRGLHLVEVNEIGLRTWPVMQHACRLRQTELVRAQTDGHDERSDL
jgi:hypothetical protein